MNIKVSTQLSRFGRRGIEDLGRVLGIRFKVGHKSPTSLCKLIVISALQIAEFWMETGCGSPEEMIEELHKAAEDLAQKEYR